MNLCQIEEINKGGPYPRSCPTCGLGGKCVKGLPYPFSKPKPTGDVSTQPIPAKIRVGDEIEVRLRVADLNRDGHALVRQSPTVYQVYKPEDILRHLPATRPDEIGCRIRVVAQANEAYTAAVGETGTVKFIEDGFVTFLRDAGAYGLARVDDLVRIDGESP